MAYLYPSPLAFFIDDSATGLKSMHATGGPFTAGTNNTNMSFIPLGVVIQIGTGVASSVPSISVGTAGNTTNILAATPLTAGEVSANNLATNIILGGINQSVSAALIGTVNVAPAPVGTAIVASGGTITWNVTTAAGGATLTGRVGVWGFYIKSLT